VAFFGDRFIDELRSALPIKNLVERDHKLRKAGSGEFKAIDDPSLTVSVPKNLWYDFGRGQQGGDIFAYEQFVSGCSFEEAVERLAQMVGMPLPKPQQPNGNGQHQPSYDKGPPPGHPAADPPRQAPRKQVTATYAYTDLDGGLLYEVVRSEWTDDNGKRQKSTIPRRPVPNEPGHWIWGLKDCEYVRAKNGDFYAADGRESWPGERRRFDEPPAPTLYRLEDVVAARNGPEAADAVIFLPEGEKDVDTLRSWGLVATTSMGGVNGWQPHFAQHFADLDVVVLMDNDEPGRAFGQAKAAALRGIAGRVRLLDWRDHAPGCPEKFDVSDWGAKVRGEHDVLLGEIIGKLADWTPLPPVSSFGAVRFCDLDKPAKELSWLVKGVLTRGEVSLWYGATQCGKSFLVTDMAFAIARSLPTWMGLKIHPGLVVYQAGESGLGFRQRMRAYRAANHLPADEDIPFVALTQSVDLFRDDADVQKMITEINGWRAFYATDLELVVIDTFNVASVGADENSSKDVSRVLQRSRRIAVETGAHVLIIHHMNAQGDRPRGHTSLLANADSGIEVEKVAREFDADRRPVRQFFVTKLRDDEANVRRQFVLKQVATGRMYRDVDGEEHAQTSCVVLEAGERMKQIDPAEVPPGWSQLSENNLALMRALERALLSPDSVYAADAGLPAPDGARAVKIGVWQAQWLEAHIGHEQVTDQLKGRIKKQIQRACERWGGQGGSGLVGKHGEYIWRTGRKVFRVDKAPPRPQPVIAPAPEDDMIRAPGERPEDAEL